MQHTETPIPQANDLAVLCTVVDAVADGCVTAQTIAEAIGMSGRQGGYYPNAAAALGLIEAVHTESGKGWQLSKAGSAFVGLEARGRAGALSDAILGADTVSEYSELYVEGGEDSVCEAMLAAGLADDTAQRRAASLATWVRWALADKADQIPKIEAAMTGTRNRAPGVAQTLTAKRTKAASFCGCGMQLPSGGGTCDYC